MTNIYIKTPDKIFATCPTCGWPESFLEGIESGELALLRCEGCGLRYKRTAKCEEIAIANSDKRGPAICPPNAYSIV